MLTIPICSNLAFQRIRIEKVPAGLGALSCRRIKMRRNNIPLGMFLSVEKGAKKSWHPIGMPLSGAERRIPTGCENGGGVVFYREMHPYGMRRFFLRSDSIELSSLRDARGGGVRNPKGVSHQRAGLRVSALPCHGGQSVINPNGVAQTGLHISCEGVCATPLGLEIYCPPPG